MQREAISQTRKEFKRNMVTICHIKARRYMLALAGMYMKSKKEDSARQIHSLIRHLDKVVIDDPDKLKKAETIDKGGDRA